MVLQQFQVDAFTDQLFGGNPAAVVLSDQPLPVELMQQIAAENNLSETAFLVPKDDGYTLRWFTPGTEVKLCGHATLASAHVLFQEGLTRSRRIEFYTASGTLTVSQSGGGYEMDFPARTARATTLPPGVAAVLPFEPKAVVASDGEDLMVVTTEQNVRDFNGTFAHLSGDRGIVLTARGEGEYDLVSRFFGFKQLGVDEDPVTGSAHCLIVPYWAQTLDRQEFRCLQASKRQGVLLCELRGERVILAGSAVTFAKAEIYLPSL